MVFKASRRQESEGMHPEVKKSELKLKSSERGSWEKEGDRSCR